MSKNARRLINSATPGAPANGFTVQRQHEIGNLHTVVLKATNVAVAMTDEAGVVAYGGVKFFDFPVGGINILSCLSDMDLTKSSAGVIDAWDGDFAIGTVTASNNATLTSTEANVIASTATPQAVSGATTANGLNTAAVYLDGTGTAVDLYYNLLVDDADHDVTTTPCNLILNGTITLTYLLQGDY